MLTSWCQSSEQHSAYIHKTHIVSVMVLVATWVVRVPFVAVTNLVVVLRVLAKLE